MLRAGSSWAAASVPVESVHVNLLMPLQDRSCWVSSRRGKIGKRRGKILLIDKVAFAFQWCFFTDELAETSKLVSKLLLGLRWIQMFRSQDIVGLFSGIFKHALTEYFRSEVCFGRKSSSGHHSPHFAPWSAQIGYYLDQNIPRDCENQRSVNSSILLPLNMFLLGAQMM